MEVIRKPLQGVSNIIRFNWHFYVIAFASLAVLLFAAGFFNHALQVFIYTVCILLAASIVVSLLISMYIYDLSGLYQLNWLPAQKDEKLIININAGFDETSLLLKQRFDQAELIALDFYDPAKHTEVSIKRARKAYPPYPNTRHITTTQLPFDDAVADKIFVILSAHEIRNEAERIGFFRELKRVLQPGGRMFITEHLRDLPNFLAYNIGFFHFHSKASWVNTFNQAGLRIEKEQKQTSFISTFILVK